MTKRAERPGCYTTAPVDGSACRPSLEPDGGAGCGGCAARGEPFVATDQAREDLAKRLADAARAVIAERIGAWASPQTVTDIAVAVAERQVAVLKGEVKP